MGELFSLYKILIGVSAAALVFGLALMSGKISRFSTAYKNLYLLGIANLGSMLFLIFDLSQFANQFKGATVFFESLILIVNLIIAAFVVRSILKPNERFASSAIQLFTVVFISLVLLLSTYYILKANTSIYQLEGEVQYIFYVILAIVLLFGSLVPAILLIQYVLKTRTKKHIHFLVIFHVISNVVGMLVLNPWGKYNEGFIVLNILFSLGLAYYLAYYFLSLYFKTSDLNQNAEKSRASTFAWDDLKNKLSYWEELKSYMNQYNPEIIQEVDSLDLTELEKIHLTLKRLNIKAKDIASAMNVSVKAIEMNRYRLKRKLEV